jgi:acetate kinase
MKVLVINCGSSSLKYQLRDTDERRVLAKGIAERVGLGGGRQAVLRHTGPSGTEARRDVHMQSHDVAMEYVAQALVAREDSAIASLQEIEAVGHRVVHGGEKFVESVIIDDDVIKEIEDCIELAPLHNPANLIGIRACMRMMPRVPHVAIFDTSFHSTLPGWAYLYALPMELYERFKVRRYGFHGTSHMYVSERAAALMRKPIEELKIVTLHLGNGASAAAVAGGKSVDTSMGFTPAEGLVMGTRCGDMDPAIVPFLIREKGLSPQEADDVLNRKSGLLGLSGKTHDMRDILSAAEAGDEASKLALDVYCYRIRKYIGAYASGMGGLDAVVFTAGVGENHPVVRHKATQGLGFLGVSLDERKNSSGDGERDISADGSKVKVFVIPTDEELVFARETERLVKGRRGQGSSGA